MQQNGRLVLNQSETDENDSIADQKPLLGARAPMFKWHRPVQCYFTQK